MSPSTSGKLLYIGIQEGESAPVDEVLAVIGPDGTDIEAVLQAKPASKAETSTTAEVEAPQEETNKEDKEEKKLDSGQRVFVSPLARKIAAEKGIDLMTVQGSGDHGRIVKRDVENFVPSAKIVAPEEVAETKTTTESPVLAQQILPTGEEHFEEVKNSQMRKVIAKRLSE